MGVIIGKGAGVVVTMEEEVGVGRVMGEEIIGEVGVMLWLGTCDVKCHK